MERKEVRAAVTEAHFLDPHKRQGDPRGLLAALLVALAMVFGGGGSTAPLSELTLEAMATAVLVAWLWLDRPTSPSLAPRSLWTIVAILVAVPLVQLVPLPPALWHSLPGRETERDALALIGQADSWQPWTVAPSRTFAALLSLGPCVLVMVMVAAVGVLAVLVGAAQLSGGEDGAFRFYGARSGSLEGFQANRNHAADVLLIAMVAFAAATREWHERWRHKIRGPNLTSPALSAVVLIFATVSSIAVIFTTSRAGMAMLPIAWLGVLLMIRPWLRVTRRALVVLAVSATVAVVLGALIVQHNHVIARIAARFTLDQEFRPRIWEDSLYAARAYFPFGSGMGTFVPVFQAIERLENIDVFLTNRAHNDVLELAIEGGAPGIAALLAISAIIVGQAAVALRRTAMSPATGSLPQVIFALVTLTVIALHSQVDYPLRSMSLQCLAGLAIGLLMARADSPGEDPATQFKTASMKDDL